MKVILCLLAVFCTVFADHHADPCLSACKTTIMGKMREDPAVAQMVPADMMTVDGRAKMRRMTKAFVQGDHTQDSMAAQPETWQKLCPIYNQAISCIDACPESPMREGVRKFLSVMKLGCDSDFVSSVACLNEVRTMPSETCKTKCTPFADKLMQFINERDADPQNMVLATKEQLESGCKFINCRVNCRKNDIVTKCQDKGFESIKKLFMAMTKSSKMMYKRAGGDLSNWPDMCKDDMIVAPHDY